jgi:hypothetical protein
MSTPDNSSTDAALRTRSWLKWLIFGIVGIVAVGLVTYQMATYEPKKKPATAQASVQTICPDASAQETLTCLMTPELSTGIKIAVMADSGKRLCFVPNLPFEKNDVNGTTFWRFKTNGGQIPMKYRLFPEEMQCPDVL